MGIMERTPLLVDDQYDEDNEDDEDDENDEDGKEDEETKEKAKRKKGSHGKKGSKGNKGKKGHGSQIREEARESILMGEEDRWLRGVDGTGDGECMEEDPPVQGSESGENV